MSDRKCKACGEIKALAGFPIYRVRGKSGSRGTCTACWNAKWSPIVQAHNQRYYDTNRAGMRDAQKRRTRAAHRAPGGKAKHHARNDAYEARYPERTAARAAVAVAVRSGRLVRQPCIRCGSKAHAHHDDYAKPLTVIWLCPEHHGERHRLLRRYGAAAAIPPEFNGPDDLKVRQFPEAHA